jgi:hypothetical protein
MPVLIVRKSVFSNAQAPNLLRESNASSVADVGPAFHLVYDTIASLVSDPVANTVLEAQTPIKFKTSSLT